MLSPRLPRTAMTRTALIVTLLFTLALGVQLTGSASAAPSYSVGSVQVILTVCQPADDTAEPETDFQVNQPQKARGAQTPELTGCARGVHQEYRLTELATDGFRDMTTGRDGEVSARELTPGAYSLTEQSSGNSVEFDVVGGYATIINVTNYDYPESGTLEVISLACPGQDGPFITIDWPNRVQPGDPNGTISGSSNGCQYESIGFTLLDEFDNVIWEASTSDTGLAVIDLPAGDYRVHLDTPNEITGYGFVYVDRNTKAILTVAPAA